MPERRHVPGVSPGLTLMEVLVVLIIFGIGWFPILPNWNLLDMTRQGSSSLDRLNTLMGEVRSLAMKKGTIERMTIIPGKRTLAWGNAETSFPAAVSRCQVNGRQNFDRPTEFRVYPSGDMDDVRVVLDGGAVLSTNILGAEFVAAK